MKTKTNILITALLFAGLTMFTSCNNDESDTSNERSYMDNIVGTYTGDFSLEKSSSGTPAIANVSLNEEDQLIIHCYGEIMDTIIVMDAFQNGDSVMVCNTGEDFYQEYGHMGNGYHMMDMRMNQTEWMHHMQNDHQTGDEHYGGFDMQRHSFHYEFKMMENDTLHRITFNGVKQ